MAGDITTVARPYAEAVFELAVKSDKLDIWQNTLAFLASAIQTQPLADWVTSPRLSASDKADLLVEISNDHLDQERNNLIKLLATNERLVILPEIAKLYKKYKAEYTGAVDVVITTAYALELAQEKMLSGALQKKLGCAVNIHTKEDSTLIGGFKLRAGDMVIDGSVSGQINQLAHELGI